MFNFFRKTPKETMQYSELPACPVDHSDTNSTGLTDSLKPQAAAGKSLNIDSLVKKHSNIGFTVEELKQLMSLDPQNTSRFITAIKNNNETIANSLSIVLKNTLPQHPIKEEKKNEVSHVVKDDGKVEFTITPPNGKKSKTIQFNDKFIASHCKETGVTVDEVKSAMTQNRELVLAFLTGDTSKWTLKTQKLAIKATAKKLSEPKEPKTTIKKLTPKEVTYLEKAQEFFSIAKEQGFEAKIDEDGYFVGSFRLHNDTLCTFSRNPSASIYSVTTTPLEGKSMTETFDANGSYQVQQGNDKPSVIEASGHYVINLDSQGKISLMPITETENDTILDEENPHPQMKKMTPEQVAWLNKAPDLVKRHGGQLQDGYFVGNFINDKKEQVKCSINALGLYKIEINGFIFINETFNVDGTRDFNGTQTTPTDYYLCHMDHERKLQTIPISSEYGKLIENAATYAKKNGGEIIKGHYIGYITAEQGVTKYEFQEDEYVVTTFLKNGDQESTRYLQDGTVIKQFVDEFGNERITETKGKTKKKYLLIKGEEFEIISENPQKGKIKYGYDGEVTGIVNFKKTKSGSKRVYKVPGRFKDSELYTSTSDNCGTQTHKDEGKKITQTPLERQLGFMVVKGRLTWHGAKYVIPEALREKEHTGDITKTEYEVTLEKYRKLMEGDDPPTTEEELIQKFTKIKMEKAKQNQATAKELRDKKPLYRTDCEIPAELSNNIDKFCANNKELGVTPNELKMAWKLLENFSYTGKTKNLTPNTFVEKFIKDKHHSNSDKRVLKYLIKEATHPVTSQRSYAQENTKGTVWQTDTDKRLGFKRINEMGFNSYRMPKEFRTGTGKITKKEYEWTRKVIKDAILEARAKNERDPIFEELVERVQSEYANKPLSKNYMREMGIQTTTARKKFYIPDHLRQDDTNHPVTWESFDWTVDVCRKAYSDAIAYNKKNNKKIAITPSYFSEKIKQAAANEHLKTQLKFLNAFQKGKKDSYTIPVELKDLLPKKGKVDQRTYELMKGACQEIVAQALKMGVAPKISDFRDAVALALTKTTTRTQQTQQRESPEQQKNRLVKIIDSPNYKGMKDEQKVDILSKLLNIITHPHDVNNNNRLDGVYLNFGVTSQQNAKSLENLQKLLENKNLPTNKKLQALEAMYQICKNPDVAHIMPGNSNDTADYNNISDSKPYPPTNTDYKYKQQAQKTAEKNDTGYNDHKQYTYWTGEDGIEYAKGRGEDGIEYTYWTGEDGIEYAKGRGEDGIEYTYWRGDDGIEYAKGRGEDGIEYTYWTGEDGTKYAKNNSDGQYYYLDDNGQYSLWNNDSSYTYSQEPAAAATDLPTFKVEGGRKKKYTIPTQYRFISGPVTSKEYEWTKKKVDTYLGIFPNAILEDVKEHLNEEYLKKPLDGKTFLKELGITRIRTAEGKKYVLPPNLRLEEGEVSKKEYMKVKSLCETVMKNHQLRKKKLKKILKETVSRDPKITTQIEEKAEKKLTLQDFQNKITEYKQKKEKTSDSEITRLVSEGLFHQEENGLTTNPLYDPSQFEELNAPTEDTEKSNDGYSDQTPVEPQMSRVSQENNLPQGNQTSLYPNSEYGSPQSFLEPPVEQQVANTGNPEEQTPKNDTQQPSALNDGIAQLNQQFNSPETELPTTSDPNFGMVQSKVAIHVA